MYKVLMPVDTSEQRALAQAEHVADIPAAPESVEVLLLFVFQDDSGELPDDLSGLRTATRVGSVRRAKDHLEGQDIDVTIREDSGDTAQDLTSSSA